MRKIEILGTPLLVTNYDELIRHCQELVRSEKTQAVDLSNTQVITMRRHEAAFREATSRVDWFIPDGMPLIWLMNRSGAQLRDRVYGPTFMRRCMHATAAPFTHYLLGGSDGCLSLLRRRLLEQQPDLQIVGSRNGYFASGEEDAIVEDINRLAPDFIWVGLGTPKQQDWIYRTKGKLTRGVIFAVGFAFDVNAGTKEDAPLWMQRLGLTWLFRVVSEPRRLLGRYLRYNTLFLFYVAKDVLFGPPANQSDGPN